MDRAARNKPCNAKYFVGKKPRKRHLKFEVQTMSPAHFQYEVSGFQTNLILNFNPLQTFKTKIAFPFQSH